jgi:membrane-associated phospholipid phosphatase
MGLLFAGFPRCGPGRLTAMVAGWRRPLFLAGVCWFLFAVVLVAAYELPVARWADGWSVEGFLNLQTPWLTSLATHVAHLANPVPFAVSTALLAIVALYRGRPRHALAVTVFLASSNVTTQVLKTLLAHPRHHDFLGKAQIASAAYPSGHATASMGLALAAVLVSAPAWRPYVAAAGALFALCVSESVMLLAWHFPSDVAGGFLVATAFALLTVAALRAAEQRWPERTGREAARRAISGIDLRRAGLTIGAFVAAALGAIALAKGTAAMEFAAHHTTAVFSVVVVAAMAAALPAMIASLGARRS